MLMKAKLFMKTEIYQRSEIFEDNTLTKNVLDDVDDVDDDELSLNNSSDNQKTDKDSPTGVELFTPVRLRCSDRTVSFMYDDSGDLKGTHTQIIFSLDTPNIITLQRTGFIRTAMVFEAGKRHICTYVTPFAQVEFCIHTFSVENTVSTDGKIKIKYAIEVRGAEEEATMIDILLTDLNNNPIKFD